LNFFVFCVVIPKSQFQSVEHIIIAQ